VVYIDLVWSDLNMLPVCFQAIHLYRHIYKYHISQFNLAMYERYDFEAIT
jgi:hypothetical protein